jgi:hypothetical protein
MELAMNRKLFTALGLVGVMAVAVAPPTVAAWSPFTIRASHSDADSISANQAMAHVSAWTNVQGTVSEIFTNRGIATIVDVGGHYPDLAFRAVLFPDAASSGKLSASERRIVIVSGTIKLSHGQPEIFVTSRNQIAL